MNPVFKFRVLWQRFSKKPPKVVFIHVPKCGGSSVERAIGEYYLWDRMPNISDKSLRVARRLNLHLDTENPDPFGSKEINAIFCYLLASNKPFIGGHFRISQDLIPHIKKHYKLVTLLRDPVERFVSNYVYSRIRLAQDGIRSSAIDITQELEEYLGADDIYAMANRFCCYFGAERLIRQGRLSQAAEMARANLEEFDAVGFLNNIPALQRQLRQLLELPKLTIGHERITENFVEPGGRTASNYRELFNEKKTMALIKDVCAADCQFYEMALDKKNSG